MKTGKEKKLITIRKLNIIITIIIINYNETRILFEYVPTLRKIIFS